jgi:surfeit locus 1 family protein
MARNRYFFAFIVFAATAVFIRLAVWQYDRHLEKTEQNKAIAAQISLPPLFVLPESDPALIPAYRRLILEGEYDFEQQILLKNRTNNGQAGYHVITPLFISGQNLAALVDRGWIPLDQSDAEFSLEGRVQITGTALPSSQEPSWSILADPTLEPNQAKLEAWRVLDISRIQEQIPYELLPFYVKLAETETSESLYPIPVPDFEMSTGSHLGYAIQWVAFALIAVIGGAAWYRSKWN